MMSVGTDNIPVDKSQYPVGSWQRQAEDHLKHLQSEKKEKMKF